jgi:uncharacterized protein involved in response to NO
VSALSRYVEKAAVLSGGFRPFFLAAPIFAAVAIALWLPAYFGEINIPTAFAPRDWHVHEMLFGFAPAVVAGFLLTAVPNWTGRLPLKGLPLLLLLTAWLVGRIAVFFSGALPWVLVLLLDCLFLASLFSVILREIVAGENWRNLRVASLVALLLCGNAGFHVEAHITGAVEYASRAGLSAIILLVILVGGRVIPSFTRNWLARMKGGRLPAPFGWFDAASISVAALALATWTFYPDNMRTGVLLFLAGLLQAVRLARWAGDRTFADRLVFILHAAYAFIPLGFLLLACASFGYGPKSAGIHAFGAGAVGLMALAMMSRVSLGHSGQKLIASRLMQVSYVCVCLAAALRTAAALATSVNVQLLHAAAFFWIAGFAIFICASWNVFLLDARRGTKPIAR